MSQVTLILRCRLRTKVLHGVFSAWWLTHSSTNRSRRASATANRSWTERSMNVLIIYQTAYYCMTRDNYWPLAIAQPTQRPVYILFYASTSKTYSLRKPQYNWLARYAVYCEALKLNGTAKIVTQHRCRSTADCTFFWSLLVWKTKCFIVTSRLLSRGWSRTLYIHEQCNSAINLRFSSTVGVDQRDRVITPTPATHGSRCNFPAVDGGLSYDRVLQ